MISVKNLSKIYADDGAQTTALEDVSFEIKKGEFVSIMGPSGSGKSTLLHLLSLLDRPTSGSYKFLDKSTNDLTDNELAHIRNKEVGFVFQSFNLLSRSSVYENVEMPLLYSTVPVAQRKELVEKSIEAVGLKEKTWIEAGRLSGGQKQRVAIARALVNDPNVIFADEPTGNLDSKSGRQIMEILEELHGSGRTIILVTHETYTAAFSERLIRLKDGAIEVDELTDHKLRGKDFFK
ncbi:MAG: ABC transporter ATP-binding protein [bacterium]|nr:ABC transporter ATP-binding protein [bacterium]